MTSIYKLNFNVERKIFEENRNMLNTQNYARPAAEEVKSRAPVPPFKAEDQIADVIMKVDPLGI
jgi:hypothetical protein